MFFVGLAFEIYSKIFVCFVFSAIIIVFWLFLNYMMKLSFLNARSLLGPFNEFRDYFEKTGSDIVVVTDTWLNEEIDDGVIVLAG